MCGIQIIWNHVVFEETAVGICDALFLSGFDAEVCRMRLGFEFRKDILYVILGLHRFLKVPETYIAIQAEQVESKWMTESYLNNLLRAVYVWDFSSRNCAFLREKGIVCHKVRTRVPMDIFYPGSSSMVEHFSRRTKDIDVLFYGARCPRRESIERDFKKTSLRVVFRYNDLFREEREHLICRSKVVLNIHYWPTASLETHRIEYLCSRGKCVVSERSMDSELDSDYSGSIAFVSSNCIVATAEHYATKDESRGILEARSQRNSFKTQTDTSVIKSLISALAR